MPVPLVSVVVRLVPAALLLAACYSFAQPSYRPGDARDILMDLRRRRVEVSSSVTGASACSDPSLTGNALHLVARLAGEAEARDIFVYTFRPRSWDGSDETVDACQAEYQAAHPSSTVTRLDIPTYRAFGADWTAGFAEAVRGALEEASQQGE